MAIPTRRSPMHNQPAAARQPPARRTTRWPRKVCATSTAAWTFFAWTFFSSVTKTTNTTTLRSPVSLRSVTLPDEVRESCYILKQSLHIEFSTTSRRQRCPRSEICLSGFREENTPLRRAGGMQCKEGVLPCKGAPLRGHAEGALPCKAMPLRRRGACTTKPLLHHVA